MTLHATSSGGAIPSYAFLHGLFGQGRNWAGIAKALEPASSLLVDLPNHGDSPRTPTVDIDADADAVAAILPAPLTLVGHSLGGKVAMRLALRHPELVERLVVVDISPVPGIAAEFRGYIEALRALDLRALGSRAEADAILRRAIPDERVRGFLLANLRRTDDGWRWLANLELFDAELAALGDWPKVAEPPYLGPVLWIAGENSPYVRDEHHAAMLQLFPTATLVRIKGAGHWVHSDAPAAFVQTLRAFAPV